MARLPLQQDCVDSDDPKVKHQWVLVALPFHGMTPFTMEPELREQWSERIDEAGYVHGPTLAKLADENGNIHVSQLPEQKVKFIPPHRGQQQALNNSGVWVDMDEEDPEPVALPDMAEYTRHEQEFVAEQLRYHGVVRDPEPAVEGAVVVPSGPLFNPSDHTASGVNGYLLAPISDAEKRRVIAAEQMGRKRQGILRAPQNKGI